MALRAFSCITTRYWSRIVRHRPYSTASSPGDPQVSSSCASAFWDPEGSEEVKDAQTGDLEYLKNPVAPNKAAKEPSEVVRLTNFGHVRLDGDNQPGAFDEVKGDDDSINYIDSQFFRSHLASGKPAQEHHSVAVAADVPLDTNFVDQQYFNPSKTTDEAPTKGLIAPSAAELNFPENEVDDQYFGKKNLARASQKDSNPTTVSAYDYLRSMRQKKAPAEAVPSYTPQGYDTIAPTKIHADFIPQLWKLSKEIIAHVLKKRIIYNKDGIVAIDKPYGMATTDVDDKNDIVLTHYLPILSKLLKCEELRTVHRLDRDTTGVLLLAANKEMAARLNQLFVERVIKKKYVAITKGVPNPREGIIDIPMCERNVGDRQRMGLRPVKAHHEPGSAQYNARSKASRAVTHYRVIRSSNTAALVELEPETGVRHQLRVHLSEAINCQILGDHKYAHPDRYAPQKLPEDMLDCLGIRQSKARNIPMHLHASSLLMPGLGEQNGDLLIRAPLPAMFHFTMKKLKLYSEPKKR